MHAIHFTDQMPRDGDDPSSTDQTSYKILSRVLSDLLGSVLMGEAIASQLLMAIRESGHAIVPMMPTKEMLDAAWADALNENATGVWSAMIGASLQIRKSK